jgi:scyllo-inositol 2-dehydrogenase (NADP+)
MVKIKLGIIGYGGMGHWHGQNAPRAGVEIAAVYDIDPERLEMAEKDGFTVYKTLDDFLGHEDMNFVLIATPNDVHKEQTIAALRAGKHVMVEKPAAMSVAEWDEMVAESQKADKILTVHHNRRWDRDYRVMRKVVEEGCIGKVLSIESRVFGTGGALFGWRGFPQFGGGMVYDWGVHLFDQLLNMYSDKKITSVYAKLMTVLDQEVDDYFKVTLTVEDGPLLHVEVGTFAFYKLPRWYVIGNDGTLQIDDFTCEKGGYTKPRYTDMPVAPVVVMTPAGPTRMMAPRPPETKEDFPLPQVETDWTELYQNLVDVMEGKAELIVKPHQIRRVLELIEAIFKSAKENRSIEVSI